MTKKGAILSAVAAVLAVLYVIYFTDWFRPKVIDVYPQVRPGRASAIPRPPDSPPVLPVSFSLKGKHKLTCVKVFAEAEFKTNRLATPLWHLISDATSVPVKSILYGYPIKGMKPSVPRSRPKPLEPEVPYVLIVEAGGAKGQVSFQTRLAPPPRAD